jgi:hypothetical protein
MRSRVVRSGAVALVVGATVGLLVAGGGARLAMRLIALADNREDFGATTGSEATVGEITLGGTVAVLLTGLALGIMGALLYVALRAWLPVRGGYRSVIYVLIVLGLGLSLTIDGNQGDFVFLDTATSLATFAAVLVLYAPRVVRRSRFGHSVVACVLAISLVVGTLAVKHAFEYADGSRLPG